MRHTQKAIAIISAENSNLAKLVNESRTDSLDEKMRRMKLSFSYCEGMYKGQSEFSFLVLTPDQKTIDKLISLGREFNQESILFSRPDYSTYLYMIESGDIIELGNLHEVENIDGLEAYTKIGSRFFTCD